MNKTCNNLLIIFSLIFIACENDNTIHEHTQKLNIPIPIDKDIAVDSVQYFTQTISSRADANRLAQTFEFSDFVPTGAYVESNSTFKFNLKLEKGTDCPEILIGTYSHSSQWNQQPQKYKTKKGLNIINVGKKGGLVYVKYTSEQAKEYSKAKIEFLEGWKHSPVYKFKKTSKLIWKKMLTELDVPSATIIGDKAFIVLFKNTALKYVDKNLDETLSTIDHILELENEYAGMDASDPLHEPLKHKLLLVEYTGDYYMFAYNCRTAYNTNGIKYLLDPELLIIQGWGPWHELGHMHQMFTWTWSQLTEVTVNLYSLYVEKSLGIKESRLVRDHTWPKAMMYLNQKESLKNFNSDKTNIWVRLCMFYQLDLAFGKKFYQDLHKALRSSPINDYKVPTLMRNFMLNACKVSGKDLSSFFRAWGWKFDGDDKVYNEISKLNLPQPDQDISKLTE
jgi:hypothetical protein